MEKSKIILSLKASQRFSSKTRENLACFFFFTTVPLCPKQQITVPKLRPRWHTQCGEQYFEDEIAENIEKIVNQLKKLSTEVTIVNYKEKVAQKI